MLFGGGKAMGTRLLKERLTIGQLVAQHFDDLYVVKLSNHTAVKQARLQV